MKLETLQKLGGISLILGSILLITYSLLAPLLLPIKEMHSDFSLLVLNSNWIWLTTIAFFSLIFMLFGFTAVYSKIYEKSGRLGFFGYIFTIIAYLLQACEVSWEIFIYPIICQNLIFIDLLKKSILKDSFGFIIFGAISNITIIFGIVFLSIALIRSKIFPKIAGILVLIGALLYGFGPLFNTLIGISGIFIFSIGCFVTSIHLLQKK